MRVNSKIVVLLVAVCLCMNAFAAPGGDPGRPAKSSIVILNLDPPGVGFNDPTPAAPVGGNPGTTKGQQALIAFQTAADIWASHLKSKVPIRVRGNFAPLACTATSAVLGSAGPLQIFSNFKHAEEDNTWYVVAEANAMAKVDLAPNDPADPSTDDIRARFNGRLGEPGCLTGIHFYLGLDGNHGTDIDLLAVLLHEFGHGLGFINITGFDGTFCCASTNPPSPGDPIFPDIVSRMTFDNSFGKFWTEMTDGERAASTLNARKVVFTGKETTKRADRVLVPGTPLLTVNSPTAIAGTYDVGAAVFGPALTADGVTGSVAFNAANNLACNPFAPGTFAGKIALVDRGVCGFIVKVKNAQDAGATAVLVADNTPTIPPAALGGADPTITIPSVRISLADGNNIKAQLAGGVNVTLGVDLTRLAGADTNGRVLFYTPNPLEPGSSVSHFDTSAFKNLLMEPAINGDLTHDLDPPNDLTHQFMLDIGWKQ